MATTGPSTPDSTPRKGGRSFSTSAKKRIPSAAHTTNNTPLPAAIGEAAGIETLYTNAKGKVVKFNCSSSRSRPSSSAGSAHQNPVSGTLPWATLTEQTLASGPLEIYRVPGSVSFLHSGSLLHAILPRSNCWCVDGVSKFAMRVLTDTYYRIELPGETEDELAQVEEFKSTLKKVLFYERTACPFARTFEVSLPEEQAPRRRRDTTHGPAKKWRLDRAYSWKPEDGGEPPQLSTSEEEEEEEGSLFEEGGEEMETTTGGAASILEEAKAELKDEVQELKIMTPSRPSVRDRVKGLTMRSVTAPPQLSRHLTSPSRLRTSETTVSIAVPQVIDPPGLRSFQAIPTDMPPSPPDSSAGFEYTKNTTRDDEDVEFSDSRLHNPRLRQHREETPSLVDVNHQADLHGVADWKDDEVQAADADADAEDASIYAEPPSKTLFVNAENLKTHAILPEETNNNPTIVEDDDCEETLDRVLSLPQKPQVPDATATYPDHTPPLPPTTPVAKPDTDPFAQIQARIQARRSIGGSSTSGFVPHPRQTSTSTQGASPPTGFKPRTLSHKSSSISRHSSQQQQYLATALVKKACAVFLGPPAHLVVLMLKIAARFAKGVFPKSLLCGTPRGERRRVPGSFNLSDSDDDYGLSDDDESLGDEEWEDDFGVPINSPVRLTSAAGLRERVSRNIE